MCVEMDAWLGVCPPRRYQGNRKRKIPTLTTPGQGLGYQSEGGLGPLIAGVAVGAQRADPFAP